MSFASGFLTQAIALDIIAVPKVKELSLFWQMPVLEPFIPPLVNLNQNTCAFWKSVIRAQNEGLPPASMSTGMQDRWFLLLCDIPPRTPTVSFDEYVHSLQNDCSRPVYFLQAWPFGYGSMLNVGMEVAVNAWLHGYRVAFPPSNATDDAVAYYDETLCLDSKNVFACLFAPLSDCIDDPSSYKFQHLWWNENKHRPWFPEDMYPDDTLFVNQKQFEENATTSKFFGMVYTKLYKPRMTFQEIVSDQFKLISSESMNISQSAHSYVCVHIRGSEKSSDGVVGVSISAFAQTTLDHALEQENVWLMAEESDQKTEFRNIFSRINSTRVVYSMTQVPRTDPQHAKHLSNLLASMEYCVGARVVVGTLSSNIGRLNLVMRQNKGLSDSSFISLDAQVSENFQIGSQWTFSSVPLSNLPAISASISFQPKSVKELYECKFIMVKNSTYFILGGARLQVKKFSF